MLAKSAVFPVLLPFARDMYSVENTIYVANLLDNTVSVIDGKNNSKIGNDIPVGKGPSAISVNTNTIYVANQGDDTVSVIDEKTNNVIKDIPVGKGPSAIVVNEGTNTIYVANYDDNSVSVIDGKSNKVVSKVMLNVEPFNSAHIVCDTLIAPLSQQIYLYPGAKCTAKSNQGYEFVDWQQNLQGNSSQFLQVSTEPSIFDSILDLLHMKSDKPEATLNITKFGSFTANFKALPPPVPAEYIATLFTIIVTTFIGTWLTPTVIGWRKSRNQGKRLGYYHNQINGLLDDGRLDEKDINKIDFLRNNITDKYTNGKINKEQFDKLKEEISLRIREIFKNEIDSLDISENEKEKKLTTLTDKIDDIYNKGKINKEQFDKLKEEISLRYREIFKNEIDYLDNLSEYDKEKRLNEIKIDIEDAYADEKINELHYNLLQKKLLKYDK
jgi:YVTN family beta-propeller protein